MNTLITYCFGLPFNTSFLFKKAVIKKANFLAGGCTVTYSDGYWVNGAEKEALVYRGAVEHEECMKIEMLVPTARVEFIMDVMRFVVINALRADHDEKHENQPKLDMDWVQVTTVPVRTHNFSTAEDV